MTAKALTIAGSDSGGGAGIQADLKTFSALGVYGASVITALTAQNTRGVDGVFDVPADFVTAQIDAVFCDIDFAAVRFGPAAIEFERQDRPARLHLLLRQFVLGMAFDAIMMVPGWVHMRSKPADFQLKIERICEHIDHICQMAGNAKHVGIGTDLDGGYGTEQTPTDLNSIADLQQIPALLRQRGYSQSDIEGIMWRNFVDFLRRVWK